MYGGVGESCVWMCVGVCCVWVDVCVCEHTYVKNV